MNKSVGRWNMLYQVPSTDQEFVPSTDQESLQQIAGNVSKLQLSYCMLYSLFSSDF